MSIFSGSRRASQKSISSITTSASKPRKPLQATLYNAMCPICGTTTSIPHGGFGHLQRNTVINRMVEIYAGNSGQESIQTTCEICLKSSVIGIHHCEDCQKNLCIDCSQLHKKQKSTQNHNIRKVGAEKQFEKESKRAMKKCPVHSNFDLKLFCSNCSQVVCSECVIGLHKGHKCESVHKSVKVYSKMVNDSIHRVSF